MRQTSVLCVDILLQPRPKEGVLLHVSSLKLYWSFVCATKLEETLLSCTKAIPIIVLPRV